MPNKDEQLALAFSTAYQKASRKLTAILIAQPDPLKALLNTDIEAYYLAEMAGTIDATLLSYSDVLKEMIGSKAITQAELTALVEFDRATYTSFLKGASGQVKAELLRGVVGRFSEQELVASLEGLSGLSGPQIETVVNTAVNVFSRTVGAIQAERLPASVKYVYIGPVDDKTRDICLAMVSAGALTRDEIETQFPGSMIDGGGWNCRHRWEREVTQGQSDTKKARAEIFTRDQQGKWKEPQTIKEQREPNPL